MNTELFTGKAEAYAKARPGYPEEMMDYIATLAPLGTVVADIGAGTGKLTVMFAGRGYELFAVEPNADMRGQLALTLAPFPNAKIIEGTAENTTLPDRSVDAIVCAQALHWFDPAAFREECIRIGGPGVLVIAVYSITTGGKGVTYSKESTKAFFKRPEVKEFPNPSFFSRESWLQYMASRSTDPLPTDEGYEAHIAEMNATFDRDSTDGILRQDAVAKVFSERIE